MFVPLVMMNLLIALMGGSYERIEQNTKNAMRRQRAELLVSLEVLMTDKERANPKYFPRWIHWYRPKERDEEDDGVENGVINGVGRQLDSAKKELQEQNTEIQKELEARITTLQESADGAKKDHNEMKKEMQEQNDEIKKEIKKEMQEQNTEMKKENTEMKDRIVSLQGTVEAQQLAMEQMASHLQAIMAAVGAGKIEPEPKLEPEPEHSYEPEPEPEP